MLLRRIHAYTAIFAAPSILFFALTGALQLFDLHEAHDGYEPPAVIRGLAALHKDQMFTEATEPAAPVDAKDPTSAAGKSKAPSHDQPGPPASLILKWFFLLVTTALCVSTGIGLWLGLRVVRQKRLRWFLLSCGTALPAILAVLTGMS